MELPYLTATILLTMWFGRYQPTPVLRCHVSLNTPMYSQGRWGYNRLVKAFGTQILLADGTSELALHCPY